MKKVKSLFRKLVLLMLFILATFLLVIKYETHTAVQRDAGAFHDASLTIHGHADVHVFDFEQPADFFQAFQTAVGAVTNGHQAKIQGTHFQAGEIVDFKVRTKLHDAIAPALPTREWADSLPRCHCAERAKRDYFQRFISGIDAIKGALADLVSTK